MDPKAGSSADAKAAHWLVGRKDGANIPDWMAKVNKAARSRPSHAWEAGSGKRARSSHQVSRFTFG